MPLRQVALDLPVLELAIDRTHLVGYSTSQSSSCDRQIMPVKMVPAFASTQGAQKLHKREKARPCVQQRILPVRPEIAFKPVHIRAQIARVVRDFVFWLWDRFVATRDLQQTQRKIHSGINGK